MNPRAIQSRVLAACGVASPITALVCISLAIACYPPFSWTDNALSDLGVKEGFTPVLFNYGLVISGVLGLLFAFGLFGSLRSGFLGKAGASSFGLTTLALVAIGIFNENYRPTHYYVSVAFFLLFPVSMLLLTVAFLVSRQTRMDLFTFLTALVAAAPWIVYFAVPYVENVAIPEMISALATSTWTMVMAIRILKQPS